MGMHVARAVRTAWSAAGVLLAGAVAAVAGLRRARKPLHPHGSVSHGRLVRHGGGESTGVAWLDRGGEDDVLVRRSRALGLPRWLPDIHGLALRVPAPDGAVGDLLLASTGLGAVSRFVLTWSRSSERRPMTTLLPYRTPRGPLLIGAEPRGAGSYDLVLAGPVGPWRPFGRLTVTDRTADDEPISFDPSLNTVPGLENYGWVVRLRARAYRRARASRGDRSFQPEEDACVPS